MLGISPSSSICYVKGKSLFLISNAKIGTTNPEVPIQAREYQEKALRLQFKEHMQERFLDELWANTDKRADAEVVQSLVRPDDNPWRLVRCFGSTEECKIVFTLVHKRLAPGDYDELRHPFVDYDEGLKRGCVSLYLAASHNLETAFDVIVPRTGGVSRNQIWIYQSEIRVSQFFNQIEHRTTWIPWSSSGEFGNFLRTDEQF